MSLNHDLPSVDWPSIAKRTDQILDHLCQVVKDEKVRTFDDLRAAASKAPSDEALAPDVPAGGRLALLETMAVIHTRELIDGLEKLCDESGFSITHLRSDNGFAPFPCTEKEGPVEHCLIYTYHNIETGEAHAIIWEYTFPGTEITLYLNEYFDADALSNWEEIFCPW